LTIFVEAQNSKHITTQAANFFISATQLLTNELGGTVSAVSQTNASPFANESPSEPQVFDGLMALNDLAINEMASDGSAWFLSNHKKR